MARKWIFNLFLILILSTPVLMFLFWLFTEKKTLNILIVDKTVLTTQGQEHKSLTWVLKHRKFVKSDNHFYRVDRDYFGFFPKPDDRFVIHDLFSYPTSGIDSLSETYDAVFYTDAYGMYYNEWYLDTLQTEHSDRVYGGMDERDFQFLKRMMERGKLIIMEFNTIAHPTPYEIRKKTEDLFHFQWSGWTLRYFNLLDTMLNPEIPRWVIRQYLSQHYNKWPFKKSGIVFVHESGQLFILENGTHLRLEAPLMISTPYGRVAYSLPESFYYPYWIDITYPADTVNEIVADFYILPNQHGDSVLRHYGVPKIFPAIQEHLGYYRFYYFSGDFSDNVVSNASQYFLGIIPINQAFSDPNDLNNRSVFFYDVYYPMMDNILTHYFKWLEGMKGPVVKREN